MTRVCAWCERLLYGRPELSGSVTHTLCQDCLGDLQAGLAYEGLQLASQVVPQAS